MGGDPATRDERLATSAPGGPVELEAVRSLLRASSEQEVTEIVLAAVRSLGGDVEPVSSGRVRTIPIDLTLGTSEPLLPAGPPEVLHRLRGVVPGIVEDARIALDRIRRDLHLQESGWTDVLTGLVARPRLEEIAERLGPGDTVAAIRLDGLDHIAEELGREGAQALIASFSRSLRRHVHAADTVGRLGASSFGLLLLRTDVDAAVEVVAGLRQRWLSSRSRPLDLTTAIAAIGDRKPTRVLLAVERSLDGPAEAGRDHVLETDLP